MDARVFRVGAVWHVRWTLDGKRVQRSTGESNRQRARSVARRLYREAAMWARNGRVMPTLRELVAQWIIAHENVASSSHLRGMEAFGRLHLHELADLPIDQLSTAAIEGTRAKLLLTHSPNTVNHWSRQIRLVCNWAVHRGVIAAVPFKVKMIKVQRKPRATLPVDLTSQWLSVIDSHASEPIRIAVRLMIGLGLRESETATARWEWLDPVRQAYTPGVTKGREADPLPIPFWLINYLVPHRKPFGLIVAHENGKAYGRGFTRAAIAAANRGIGIGHVTPHRLRGTFATLLSEHGAPVQSVKRMLRHKDVRTTIGYLEVDMHRIAMAQRKMAESWGFEIARDC